jgi:hypothetical protein
LKLESDGAKSSKYVEGVVRPEKHALMNGLQPRLEVARHDDRLRFSDRGAQEVIALNLDCKSSWPMASHSLTASLRGPIFNADPRGGLRQEAAAFDIAASGLPNRRVWSDLVGSFPDGY